MNRKAVAKQLIRLAKILTAKKVIANWEIRKAHVDGQQVVEVYLYSDSEVEKDEFDGHVDALKMALSRAVKRYGWKFREQAMSGSKKRWQKTLIYGPDVGSQNDVFDAATKVLRSEL